MSFWRKQFFLRIFTIIFFVFLLSSISFLSIRVLPGDPVEILLPPEASAQQKAELREELLLDQPLVFQFFHYWKQVLVGDFGRSLYFDRGVIPLIAERTVFSFILALSSVFLSAIFSLLGLFYVWVKPKKEAVLWLYSSIFLSQPVFFVAPVLVYVFSLKLGVFPVSGYYTPFHFMLPVVTLVLFQVSVLLRSLLPQLEKLRSSMFIVSAYARGLSRRRVFWRHCFKNLMVSFVGLLSYMFTGLVTGAVIVEGVFDIPGLGLLFFEAVSLRDFPLITGLVLVVGLVYVAVNILADSLIHVIDPRSQS